MTIHDNHDNSIFCWNFCHILDCVINGLSNGLSCLDIDATIAVIRLCEINAFASLKVTRGVTWVLSYQLWMFCRTKISLNTSMLDKNNPVQFSCALSRTNSNDASTSEIDMTWSMALSSSLRWNNLCTVLSMPSMGHYRRVQ